MGGSKAQQIELGLDVGASALFASAVMFAVAKLALPLPAVCAAVAASLLGCLAGLRRVGPDEPTFALAHFSAEHPKFEPLGELLLTESDRFVPEASKTQEIADELLLDDVLTELGADSRVVRLFDASAMPTPGQLRSRIDAHLSRGNCPDASQALHDALAELRRSLR